jgi:acetyl esterase/lipase
MAIPESGRVTIEEGVVFGTGGGRELRCDIYTPPAAPQNAPAVLLVHGGGWSGGDRSQLRGYGILLGRQGFVCVASEYRLSGEAPWPAQIHDVKAALRWMRANHRRLGIDPDRISISGNSAGGHLVLIAGGTANVAAFEGEGGNAGVDTSVAAVLSFYPPTDFGSPEKLSGAVAELMGAHPSAEAVRDASPVTWAKRDFPPTAFFHGTKDELVAVNDSLKMYKRLIEAGASAELHIYADEPHAFDSAPLLGRQCADIMSLFLKRYVVDRAPKVATAVS